MAVSDRESSNSLVRSRHQWGDLLAYFLGPGMAWKLTFEDVVTHVLWENCRHLDMKRSKAITSLHSCNQRRITLQQEIDTTADARDISPDSPKGREMDIRLTTLRTTLGVIERSITVSEALLEHCQMMEEEARQEEAIPEEPKEESSDMEMADDEGHDDPEPPDPNEEADEGVTAPPPEDTGPTPLAPCGVVTVKEDALLMQAASQAEGPAAGPQSPRSEARMVSGEMAELSLTSPGQPEVAEDETPQ